MNAGTSQALTLTVITAVASLGANTGSAQTLNPISQNRFAQAFTLESQCGGQFSDSQVAPGFIPFDGVAISEVACGLTFTFAQALQQSQINPTSLIGSGNTFADVTSEATDIVLTIPESFYRVTFELASASRFTLVGQLGVSANSLDEQIFSNASFELATGPQNQIVISHSIATIPGSPQSDVFDLSQSGVLNPGVYTLTVTANTVFDSATSPGGMGNASFNFTFQLVSCPADLNSDGVVNAADLASMLAQWGLAGQADLNGDGTVDAADLAALLTNWGICL